jgi:hypothetical protein
MRSPGIAAVSVMRALPFQRVQRYGAKVTERLIVRNSACAIPSDAPTSQQGQYRSRQFLLCRGMRPRVSQCKSGTPEVGRELQSEAIEENNLVYRM